MKKFPCLACCITLALVSCGRVDDDDSIRSPAGGSPSGGSVSAGHGGMSGGNAGAVHGGSSQGGAGDAGDSAGSNTGGDAQGGSTAGQGGAGNAGGPGSGGDAGAGAGGGLSTVSVDANGLVYVVYTPASPSTVVTVKLDPQCGGFWPGLVLEETTCANITLSGAVIGNSKVCFALPEDPSLLLARCSETLCGLPGTRIVRNGVLKCCGRYSHDASEPGRVCMSVKDFGAVAYTRALDEDDDLTPDFVDKCIGVGNFLQTDQDHDGVGDACDSVSDGSRGGPGGTQ